MNKFFMFLVFIGLVGCVKTTGPPVLPIGNETEFHKVMPFGSEAEFQKDYDQVWSALLFSLNEADLKTETVEKESGIIKTAYRKFNSKGLKSLEINCDTGKYCIWATITKRGSSTLVKLEATVQLHCSATELSEASIRPQMQLTAKIESYFLHRIKEVLG